MLEHAREGAKAVAQDLSRDEQAHEPVDADRAMSQPDELRAH